LQNCERQWVDAENPPRPGWRKRILPIWVATFRSLQLLDPLPAVGGSPPTVVGDVTTTRGGGTKRPEASASEECDRSENRGSMRRHRCSGRVPIGEGNPTEASTMPWGDWPPRGSHKPQPILYLRRRSGRCGDATCGFLATSAASCVPGKPPVATRQRRLSESDSRTGLLRAKPRPRFSLTNCRPMPTALESPECRPSPPPA
jgi:hypothetical protein